jgi:hypothetical protein
MEEKEGEAVPVHPVKAYEGNRGMAALIHNCVTRWIEW